MARATLGRKSALKKVMKKTLKKSSARGRYAADKGRLLYNGVAACPRKPFGSATGNARSMAAAKACLNALVPRTLGLPRAVGPYTVIRTTAQVAWPKERAMLIFSPVMDTSSVGYAGDKWLSYCGLAQTGAGSDFVSSPNGIAPILMPTSELGDASELVPASMTVQCMNSRNLQNADGIFYACRVNQGLDLGGSSKTWDELRAQIISYFTPRLLAGSKLALRGVTSHSYPLNMSQYSDFLPRSNFLHTGWSEWIRPSALAPIVFMRDTTTPGSDTDLNFLVTMEWRVRFDPLNPAAASHTYHEVTSDSTWNNVIKSACAEGHGIVDTVEDVSLMGALGAAGRFAMSNPEIFV